MQFGGHETFTLREGWLSKGLGLIARDPGAFEKDDVADVLGVGRNMAYSIRHWLAATNCVDEIDGSTVCNDFGQSILKNDPYLVSATTWWMIHSELAANVSRAFTWSWFFGTFSADRFERSSALSALSRHVAFARAKPPKNETLARDLNCMLGCYGRAIPAEVEDPEDAKQSPLVGLGLLEHYTESGVFRRNRNPKPIANEVLAYAIMRVYERRGESVPTSLSITDVAKLEGGPASAFQLSPEALYETIERSCDDAPNPVVSISGMAGNRVAKFRSISRAGLLKLAFNRSREEQRV